MGTLRLIYGDQLTHELASLRGVNQEADLILMCEVKEEATYVHHHKKKIALIFSAMRHFAKELKDKGYDVEYVKYNDRGNTGTLQGEVKRCLKEYEIDQIIVTHPGEYRQLKEVLTWEKKFKVPVEICDDDRFLCPPDEFAKWAKGRKELRMEYFYRDMRKKYDILMTGRKPAGGEWNYDSQNRNPAKPGIKIPDKYTAAPDSITKEVLTLVEKEFKNHFGDLKPFHFGVTRKEALAALKNFIDKRLCKFGEFQDAMLEGEPWMFHAHISFYLNCGLLRPLECVEAAEKAYKAKKAPLNAVEGFIRQIIGWREYVRGIYWLKMPKYEKENYLGAKRKLPHFYWDGDTDLNCMKQCISETHANAYAHHIQRLMVLGNFALLAGLDPDEVNEWYLIVYADAYQWVELPNVTGMILYADGGYLASKPYAAGGAYINKMSDYCKNCAYDVNEKSGEQACPFNYLYWDFLARNRGKLSNNQRLGMMYKTLDKMDNKKKAAFKKDAKRFLEKLK